MEYERKAVTITWQVENVKYILRNHRMNLYSSEISVDVMHGTRWKIGIRALFNSSIVLTLKRAAKDNGPKEFGFHYSFFVNGFHGTSSTGQRPNSYKFQNDQKCPSVSVRIPEIEDSITIGCKIWRQTGSISKYEHFSAQTRIAEKCKMFKVKIRNFRNLSADKTEFNKILKSSTGESVMQIKLVLPRRYEYNNMRVEIISLDHHFVRHCYLRILFLDSSDNKTDIGKFEKQFKLAVSEEFDLPGDSNKFINENPALYLDNETLSLLFKIIFSPDINYEKVERIEDVQDDPTEIKQTDFFNAVELLTSKESISCDMQLHTTTETFPAHTDILIAQSPVFETMFKTNMKETVQKCIHIDDMDAETVKHMLVFLYSNILEELNWKEAVKLYIAADKYQVLALKQKCTVILKQNIDLSNCCVFFSLADTYQDKDLKRFAQNYIAEYDREVLTCDQWKKLQKNNPHLAIYYFRDQYLERSLFKQ